MLHILSQTNSILTAQVGELRSLTIQQDAWRFRSNLERIGGLMAYEISKTFPFRTRQVETPMGIADVQEPDTEVLLGCIMRAGLPFHQGMLNIFDKAGNAFISAYRKHHKDGTFDIKVEYVSCPSVEGTTLIIADPMLATGSSVVKAIEAMASYGQPSTIHIASVIGARLGVEYVQRMVPGAHIWLCEMDEELTARAYIVPGLGDAGDLAYGAKLQD